MTTSINTNISAFFGQNNLRASSADAQTSIARLSSGNQIIRAADDVAGLSVGTILRTDVSTLRTALNNTSQASSLIQVADGAIERIGEILQRQKALAVQGNSDGLSDTERGYLNQEFQALVLELDRIVSRTEFNGTNLIDGTLASSTTTLATESPNAISGVRIDSNATVDSNVLTLSSNEPIFAFSAAGTGTTINLLQGSLADADVTGKIVTGANIQLAVNIGGVVFESGDIDTSGNSNVVATFTATDGSGAAFTLDLADPDNYTGVADAGFTATATNAEAEAYATAVQAEIRKIELSQTRALENTASTDPSAITVEDFAGSSLQGLSGASFELTGQSFSTADGKAPSITGFDLVANSGGNTLSGSVQINGVNYSFTDVAISDTTFDDNTDFTGASAGHIRFVSADDSNSYLDVDLTDALANINLQDDAAIEGIQDALNAAFGSGATGGASFQVGINSADTISVAIGDLSSTSIYKDSNGVTQTLSVATGEASIAASNVLDIAINTVTATRADVGASQSRFDFAAASIEVSITNLDAARAGFLDADISQASTQFAQEQVLIQASISVLAQANQLPQNLLKLIG